MDNSFDGKLYSRILSEGLLSEAALKTFSKEAQELDTSLYEYLIEGQHIAEDKIYVIMSEITRMPYVNLHEVVVDEKAIKSVPSKFAWHYQFVPLKLESKVLTIAVDRPLSINVRDELKLILGYKLALVLSKKKNIVELLKKHYGLAADTIDKMVQRDDRIVTPAARAGIEDIEKLAGDASVIRLVNQIIFEAYKKRATDIHIEPYRGKLRLRYRVDGVLRDQKVPEDVNHFMMPIFSRIKIMSNLNIVERRIPQDGKTVVKTQDEVLDLRVSFLPTPHGESVVIRILPTKVFFGLDKLGIDQEGLERLKKLFKKPNGIIFVTGPTGSGKTTTLYAGLKEVNTDAKKIITIEDPIEYGIEGVTQIQVNERSGLTFAKGLRSMLRHDPDIMMVGEVRDKETAEIAIRVSLTGHLVVSTLHTNDAASGATRLVDIGIEPYLVASSVEAFIAQRLVRVICPKCKEEYTDCDPEIRKSIATALKIDEKGIKIFHGTGCEHCNFTGFYGRTAIYEMLIIDHDIEKLITEKSTALQIKRQAMKNGMKTLVVDGWSKVVGGITTPEEVLNVCQDLDLDTKETDEEEEGDDEWLSSDEKIGRCGKQDDLMDSERLHMRLPVRLPLDFRLVEKTEGDVMKLKKRPEKDKSFVNKGEIREKESLFAGDIITEKVPDDRDDVKPYKKVPTYTIDISAGGVVFESRYMMPVGSIVELIVDIPEEEKPIKCLAKIVRVEKDLPRTFYIAVCYLDMSGEGRKKIDDFGKKELREREETGA